MKKINLLSGPIDSTLRQFSYPLAFSFIINILYTWVDMYYVSRLGPTEVAALGVSEQILFFVFAIASGFAVGAGVMVARRIGENNKEEASHTSTQAILYMAFFSTLLAIILYFSNTYIISLMNIKGDVAHFANLYLSAVIIGLPANFLIFQVNAIVRSSGNSFFQMAILSTTILLNAIIAPFLVFGIGPFPRLEVYGAGLATAIAQIIGATISLILYFWKIRILPLNSKMFKIDWGMYFRILKLGIPASLQLISVSLNRIALSSIHFKFGEDVLTAYVLGLRIDFFVYQTIFAIGTAVEVTTGQNLGANQLKRVFAYHRSAIKQISILLCVLIILVLFGGKYFALIYTSDPNLIAKITKYLSIAAFSYLPFAVGLISIRVISGAGDYIRSLKIIATILLGVQLTTCYLLSNYTFLGYEGIWYGVLISQVLFAVAGLYGMNKKKWMKVRV